MSEHQPSETPPAKRVDEEQMQPVGHGDKLEDAVERVIEEETPRQAPPQGDDGKPGDGRP